MFKSRFIDNIMCISLTRSVDKKYDYIVFKIFKYQGIDLFRTYYVFTNLRNMTILQFIIIN